MGCTYAEYDIIWLYIYIHTHYGLIIFVCTQYYKHFIDRLTKFGLFFLSLPNGRMSTTRCHFGVPCRFWQAIPEVKWNLLKWASQGVEFMRPFTLVSDGDDGFHYLTFLSLLKLSCHESWYWKECKYCFSEMLPDSIWTSQDYFSWLTNATHPKDPKLCGIRQGGRNGPG